MVIPLAQPAQGWLYDVTSSRYFGGLAMVMMVILGAGYVAASSGISRHKSCAGRMPFDCSHPLVFVKTMSSVGGRGGVVSGSSHHRYWDVFGGGGPVMYGHDDDGGPLCKGPTLEVVGLGFPPGGFSGSLPLCDTGHARTCHC